MPSIYTTVLVEGDLDLDDPTLEVWIEVLGFLFCICISISCNSHKPHACHRRLQWGKRGLGCRGGGMLPTTRGLPAEEGTPMLFWALPSSPPVLWTRLLAGIERDFSMLGQCLLKGRADLWVSRVTGQIWARAQWSYKQQSPADVFSPVQVQMSSPSTWLLLIGRIRPNVQIRGFGMKKL